MKWLLVLLIASCNTASDLFNTVGMRLHGEVSDFRPRGMHRLIAALARNRYVAVGIAMGAIAFFSLLKLLAIAPLSFAIPATAAGYLIETVLAKYLLREQVTWRRWAGATLVASGVTLLAFR
jgi:drug/metabolite transporter (DMT)-like permease